MCSELHGYNLARLKEKRIKSHKFRVGCVLFFPHPLFSISTFARLGSNPLHFTCPKSSVSSLTCSRVIQSSEQPLLVSYSQAYKSDILTNNNSYIRNSLLYYIRVLVLSTITLIIVIHEDARDMWIIESESRKPKEISCCFRLTFFHHFPPVKKKRILEAHNAIFICLPGDFILSSQFLRDRRFSGIACFFSSFSSCLFSSGLCWTFFIVRELS